MASPSKQKRTSHLGTHWNNRSHSSITTTSDTATFHSAYAHTSSQMELHSLSQRAPSPLTTIPKSSPILKAMQMARQDSGYEETITPIPQSPTFDSRRTSLSTSSTRHSSPSKTTRRGSHRQNMSTSSRPTTKRAYRSSPQTSQLPRTSTSSGRRPSMQSRHTVPYQPTSHTQQQFQFFHFPSLAPEPVSPPQQTAPPPPTTVQYWTSDSTRRLEYAAIDAASRGVRGFFTKLVPDCILPKDKRRTKFCDGDEGSEAGSVRRYRLELPEEKSVNVECRKVSGFKRWMSFGRRQS